MGVWTKECVRIDNEIMAAIRYQDDWSGRITLHVRKIHLDGNTYYCRVDGLRVDVTDAREKLIQYEDNCKNALEWYRQTKF